MSQYEVLADRLKKMIHAPAGLTTLDSSLTCMPPLGAFYFICPVVGLRKRGRERLSFGSMPCRWFRTATCPSGVMHKGCGIWLAPQLKLTGGTWASLPPLRFANLLLHQDGIGLVLLVRTP